MHEQTDSVGQSSQTHVSKPDSDNGVPIWPKIQLSAEFKEDIRKAFLLFDRNGEGTVDVDAVRVPNFPRFLEHWGRRRSCSRVNRLLDQGVLVFRFISSDT
ncbi:unnamed protein product [Calicophoron daubneyi]|uniref:EF-hand domain-containing protein n=1 Tax=Calicophoron daubneyi TaxID=300641 RepID=A0AAV2TXV4_CALDB